MRIIKQEIMVGQNFVPDATGGSIVLVCWNLKQVSALLHNSVSINTTRHSLTHQEPTYSSNHLSLAL